MRTIIKETKQKKSNALSVEMIFCVKGLILILL